MKLTSNGIKETAAWEAAGIKLPSYSIEQVAEETKKAPVWVHFGAGNIFRIFIGGLADRLIAQGEMKKGITCVETFDFDVVDKIYKPYDNLVLAVTLKADGSTDKQVIGSIAEAIKAQSNVPEEWNRLKEIFTDPGLQMISFTITEKGYALKNAEEITSHLFRQISTMVRRSRALRWQLCVRCCLSVSRQESIRWQSYPWTTVPIMEKSSRIPSSQWRRNGKRRAL